MLRPDFNRFLPRDAMLARCMLWPCVRLSARLSVKSYFKTARYRITHTSPHCSLGLEFSDAEDLGEIRMGQSNGSAKCRWGRLKSAIFDEYLALRA